MSAHRVHPLGLRISLALALFVAAPLGAQGTANGRLEGIVTDSVHASPLADADVSATRIDGASAAPRRTITDKKGHYLFEELAPGRYAVSFASTLLDSLEFGVAPAPAVVVAGQTARADLATPSGRTLRDAACPGAGLRRWTGALLGVVTDAETQKPLAGAEVTVSWSELAIDSAARDVSAKDRVARASTNASGQYRLCGVPTDERLELQIQYHGALGPTRSIAVADAEGVLVRNSSFRVVMPGRVGQPEVARDAAERRRTGSASIVGRVTRADGQPVAGAQLRLVNGASSARSDDKGEFALLGLPEGAQELEVRRLGYGIARRAVALPAGGSVRENVVMERVVSLDSVRVVARRVRYAEFERNRMRYPGGVFLDEEEIERRGFKTLPLIISNIPGFRLISMSRGRLGIQSTHLRSCEQDRAGTDRLDPLNLVVDNMEHVEVVDVHFPEIAAIEAYPNGERAPFKYARACSVIVVWTRYIAHRSKSDADK
ncbi:MAG: TonB-dependent receptor plug [Gemmatimonadetes bacterium]|nr:TonB-dependent receptor plug [Gemmatimonadota bacterium]